MCAYTMDEETTEIVTSIEDCTHAVLKTVKDLYTTANEAYKQADGVCDRMLKQLRDAKDGQCEKICAKHEIVYEATIKAYHLQNDLKIHVDQIEARMCVDVATAARKKVAGK